MARELGMNPKKLGGLSNHRQEPWKMPLPQFIEDLYEKRFGEKKACPDALPGAPKQQRLKTPDVPASDPGAEVPF